MNREPETVNTWADGFGRWHASIIFGEPYGPAYLESQVDRIRAKARRAIRREIAARQGPGRFSVRVEVWHVDLDSLNRAWSITYREI